MDDKEFLELIVELCEEGLLRCTKYLKKHGKPACIEDDLSRLLKEADHRLDYRGYTPQLIDLINAERHPVLPFARRSA